MRVLIFIVLFGCVAPKDSVWENNLDTVQPEEVGFSSERLDRLDDLVEEYIHSNKIPGAVLQVNRKGKVAYRKSYGYNDVANEVKMEDSTIFRIASQTKAITTVALMTLYEKGAFLLDDPLYYYIPEFKDAEILVSYDSETGLYETTPAKSQITIRHILTHTSGIAYGFIHPDLSKIYSEAGVIDGLTLEPQILKDVIPKLGPLPILFEPGTKWNYGLNTDVAGYLVEVLSGKSLAAYFKDELFDPLGMKDTYFYLPEDKFNRLATLYRSTESGFEPSDDENALYPVAGAQTYYSGGGGLVSTVQDYSIFMQMLLNGGAFNGEQILGRKTVDLLSMNHIGDIWGKETYFGLGFRVVTEEGNHQTLSSAGNYSWGGIFNTIYWLDPEEELSAVLMLQILPFDHGEIKDKFKVLVYQALVD